MVSSVVTYSVHSASMYTYFSVRHIFTLIISSNRTTQSNCSLLLAFLLYTALFSTEWTRLLVFVYSSKLILSEMTWFYWLFVRNEDRLLYSWVVCLLFSYILINIILRFEIRNILKGYITSGWILFYNHVMLLWWLRNRCELKVCTHETVTRNIFTVVIDHSTCSFVVLVEFCMERLFWL